MANLQLAIETAKLNIKPENKVFQLTTFPIDTIKTCVFYCRFFLHGGEQKS